MPSSLPSVRVTRRLPARTESYLRDVWGAHLNTDDVPLSSTELRTALETYEVVVCTLTDRLSREVLDVASRRTALLANFGVGVDHIDLATAREVGIAVTNTPGVLTDDTADLAMLLLLAAARRATAGGRELSAGEWAGWRPTHLLGTRVSGATLGVVGFGRIGQAVARRASQGFGMRVLVQSRSAPSEQLLEQCGARRCDSLPALLEASDFVSLHCPATSETRHLIDARMLRHMRPSAFLVNTARGDVVDETALIEALHRGTIAGAGLDVFEHEPQVPPELLALPNVFALPHLGSATAASREAMGDLVQRNVTAFIAGNPLPDRVA